MQMLHEVSDLSFWLNGLGRTEEFSSQVMAVLSQVKAVRVLTRCSFKVR
jgi:hypothetical protein